MRKLILLSTLLALLAFAKAANAQHLGWFWPTPVQAEEKRVFVYGEIEVLASAPNIYFCGLGWHGPADRYSGIQDQGKRHCTIFSVWDNDAPRLVSTVVQLRDKQTHIGHPGGKAEDEANVAGTGETYSWQVGKVFRFSLREEADKSGHNALTTFYYFDEQRKEWVLQATIESQLGDKDLHASFDEAYSFLENWTGAHPEIPKLCLYRLWYGTTPDNLTFVRRATGDGHWGVLNDSYYLAEGNDAALDALIAKNSKSKSNWIRVAARARVPVVPDRPLSPEIVNALKSLPVPYAAAPAGLASPGPPKETTVMPKAPLYFRVAFGSKDGPSMLGVLKGGEGTGSGYNVAYIDENMKDDLADAKPREVAFIPPSNVDSFSQFSFYGPLGENGKASYTFQIYQLNEKGATATSREHLFYSWLQVEGWTYFFLNGKMTLYAKASDALKGEPVILGGECAWDIGNRIEGRKVIVSAVLKDKNGGTLQVQCGHRGKVEPLLTLLKSGKEVLAKRIVYGETYAYEAPVPVPNGTYTAKVEFDAGPYLGKVAGEKMIQVKNP